MHRQLLTIVCTLLVAGAASSAEVSTVAKAIETFKPPHRVHAEAPSYPVAKQRLGQEGWVTLNYMVDTNGKPYDITVVDSNDRAFEQRAIKAAEKWRYEPAMLGDQPIDAGTKVRITFALSGQAGAQRKFVSRYKRLMKAIEEGMREKADKEFANMDKSSRNLYEEAYYQLARYQYAAKWENEPRAQLWRLNRATQLDGNNGFLPDDMLTSLLRSRLAREIDLQHLADALRTAEILNQREIDEDTQTLVDRVRAEIGEVKTSDRQFTVSDTIRPDNRDTHRLLKDSFSFSKVDGDIAELRLHCDKGYLGFTYEPDIIYRVNSSWQNCMLIMIGTPGTDYTLLEGA